MTKAELLKELKDAPDNTPIMVKILIKTGVDFAFISEDLTTVEYFQEASTPFLELKGFKEL